MGRGESIIVTKQRPALSFELALAKIAGVIGWDVAGEIVGQSERTIRNWSDPDTQSGVRMDAALKLDLAFRAAGGEGAPLFQCYALRLDAEVAEFEACKDKLAAAASEAARESGQATAALIAASRPGATETDRQVAIRETEEAIEAFTGALGRLGPVNRPEAHA